ncbi:cobalamin-binding protein, partial [Micromonospora aurantiaca]|nr:cobalamin-binding protein [Micromonospora aurantiaca]
GGEPVATHRGARSAPTTWDALRAARPEVVLVAPCGFRLDGAAEQAATVAGHFPDAQVWALDADGLIVRAGPRLVDGAETIAAILHPDAVPPPRPETAHRLT